MSFVYVDTSVIVSIVFQENNFRNYERVISNADQVISSGLIEAELYSVSARENVLFETMDSFLKFISIVFPDRSLVAEYRKLLAIDYLRGADLHHLASALFLDPNASKLIFLTADKQQRKIAKGVGFEVGS